MNDIINSAPEEQKVRPIDAPLGQTVHCSLDVVVNPATAAFIDLCLQSLLSVTVCVVVIRTHNFLYFSG